MSAALHSADANQPRESFEDFVAMSRAMLNRAQRGEWEEVMRMQGERQERLEAYFAALVPAQLADQVAAGIREILDLDRRIMELGRRGMDALAGEMNGLRAGRQAQKAYGAIGS